MSIVFKQLKHRFKFSKYLILIYFTSIFLFSSMSYSFTIDEVYMIKNEGKDITEFVNLNYQVSLLILLAIAIIVISIIKLYKDYKYGTIRWHLLTNHKKAFVVGDVLYISIELMLLTAIFTAAMYYTLSQMSTFLGHAYVNSERIFKIIQHLKVVGAFISKEPLVIVKNTTYIIAFSALCVYGIQMFVGHKGKHYTFDLMILMFSIIIFIWTPVFKNLYIQIFIYGLFIIFYILETSHHWQYIRE